MSVGYIDDYYLQDADFALCVRNITDAITLFNNLEFVIHPEKSILYPTQRLVFLGFLLDSAVMRKLVMLSPHVSNFCCPLILSYQLERLPES